MKSPSALRRIFDRFGPLIKYALFGIGTASINFGIFFLGTEFIFDPNKEIGLFRWWQIVNLTAWLSANVYSFYVNRRFVFKKQKNQPILKEIAVFFGIRLISFIISSQIMSIGINSLHLNHYIAKFSGTASEVILNYFACKLLVFK